MIELIIATFSAPRRPLDDWIKLLKLAKINRLYLEPHHCRSYLLSRLTKANIRIFLEFGTFSNDPDLWEKIPKARSVGQDGQVLKEITFNRKPICPSHHQVKKIKLKKLAELTRKFKFAGVWLDGLHFPSSWEKKSATKISGCFCQNCRGQFARFLKIRPNKNSKPDWPLKLYPQEWFSWRVSQLTSFLKEARKNSAPDPLTIMIIKTETARAALPPISTPSPVQFDVVEAHEFQLN